MKTFFLNVLLLGGIGQLCLFPLQSTATTITNVFAANNIPASANFIDGRATPDGYASFSYSLRPAALPGYGFDPSLGTLNKITITLGSVLNVSDSAAYMAVGQATGNGNYADTVNGAVQIIDYNGTNAGAALVSIDLTNGINSDSFLVPTNGSASGSLVISNFQTKVITDLAILTAFALNPGVQSYNFELIDNVISGVGTYLAQGSPNAVAQFSSTIIYDYTPTSPLLLVETLTNGAKLCWQASPAVFRLQQNVDLNTTNWVFVTNSINLVTGTNQVLVTPISGRMYFRLINP